jgi:hypothetical protein
MNISTIGDDFGPPVSEKKAETRALGRIDKAIEKIWLRPVSGSVDV